MFFFFTSNDQVHHDPRADSGSGAKPPSQVEPAPEEDVDDGCDNFSPDDSSEDQSFTELQYAPATGAAAANDAPTSAAAAA